MIRTNRIFLFLFTISFLFWIGTSCSTIKYVKELPGNYDRKPVYAKSLIDESLADPKIMNRIRISNAYVSSKDSFVVTLFDMNENKSFVDAKDVVVVSSIKDSVAPIIPGNNCNVAFFEPGLMFDFYGAKYQLVNASSDGKHIDIHPIKSNQDFNPQIMVTDQVSNELLIPEIDASQSYNLLETIQNQHKKYVLLNFWSPNCPPCFENIPKLKKFESSGIGLINIFYMDDDEIKLVENQVSRFEIPGINFRTSPALIKYFSQNGFPQYVLVDADANKILINTHRIREQEDFLRL